MPELPEVETIKKDLEKSILGRSIKKIEVNKPRIIKEPSPERFKQELKGRFIITNVICMTISKLSKSIISPALNFSRC